MATLMTRFLAIFAIGSLLLTVIAGSRAQEVTVTGTAPANGSKFDDWMKAFLVKHQIPGGALAIVQDGKLVYSRGFGWADRDTKEPVQPDALFRIASVSKPITAVAILKLEEQGKLSRNDKVLDHLRYEPHFEPDGKFDERWKQVTIDHCLTHRGGWDRDKSYDPMFQARRMSRSLGVALPILPEHIIRFQLGQPLDFDPGERYAYSNFGFSLLGRIIEKVTGKQYEPYVCKEVLAPLGIERAKIGGSLQHERAEGEVCYYDVKNAEGTAVTGPGAGETKVPISYGTWRQETLDAHGGWIASAPDLARFAAAFDLLDDGTRTRGALLQAQTVKDMFAPRAPIRSATDMHQIVAHYGYGWLVKQETGADDRPGTVARHGGALACTASSLMHFPDGINLAVVFNLGQSADGKFLGRSIEGPLTELVRQTFAKPK